MQGEAYLLVTIGY